MTSSTGGKRVRRELRSPARQRGQAVVELSLILPVVAVLALFVAQVARVALDSLLVHHAAREAARAAAVEPEQSSAERAARAAAGLAPDRLTVQLAGGRQPGDALAVTVDYSAETVVPLVGRLVGDIDLSASVTIRVE